MFFDSFDFFRAVYYFTGAPAGVYAAYPGALLVYAHHPAFYAFGERFHQFFFSIHLYPMINKIIRITRLYQKKPGFNCKKARFFVLLRDYHIKIL
jgi:hypothetical protein